MYYIVFFPNTDETEIVPTNWVLTEDGVLKAFWPPFKSTIKIRQAIQERLTPAHKWGPALPIRIIESFDSYDAARRKLRKAEDEFDLEYIDLECLGTKNGEFGIRKPQRKRFRQRSFQSDEEWEEEHEDEKSKKKRKLKILHPPIPVLNVASLPPTTNYEKISSAQNPVFPVPLPISENEGLPSFFDSFQTPSLSPSSSSVSFGVFNGSEGSSSTPDIRPPLGSSVVFPVPGSSIAAATPVIAAPSPLPSSWLLPDVVGMIHSIYFNMNHYVIPTLGDLTSKVKRSPENIKSEQKPIDLPELPLKSLADFDIFDQALNVQSNYDYYLDWLVEDEGPSYPGRLTNRLLRKLLTDEVAENFNWKARGQSTKRPFMNVKMCNLILDTVRTKLGKKMNAEEIKTKIKSWLKFAKFRKK